MRDADALAHLLAANAARRAGRTADDDEAALARHRRSDQQLAVYGSLAPGGENHHLLTGCPGDWTTGTVHGRVAERTFRVFTFDPAGARIPVHVLHSPQLAAFWPQLDAFEGDDYRRILVPVTGADGTLRIANLYEAVLPVP